MYTFIKSKSLAAVPWAHIESLVLSDEIVLLYMYIKTILLLTKYLNRQPVPACAPLKRVHGSIFGTAPRIVVAICIPSRARFACLCDVNEDRTRTSFCELLTRLSIGALRFCCHPLGPRPLYILSCGLCPSCLLCPPSRQAPRPGGLSMWIYWFQRKILPSTQLSPPPPLSSAFPFHTLTYIYMLSLFPSTIPGLLWIAKSPTLPSTIAEEGSLSSLHADEPIVTEEKIVKKKKAKVCLSV